VPTPGHLRARSGGRVVRRSRTAPRGGVRLRQWSNQR
jgi:hypothetical protein